MKRLLVKIKDRKGFAILFTVLISAIVLAIALGISNIAYQETVLSSSAKEADAAFFAADTGAECALYWDIEHDGFNPLDPNGTGGAITCANTTLAGFSAPFYIPLNNNASCAAVTVEKDYPAAGNTLINSLGYNVSCYAVENNLGGPKMVERSLQVTY